MAHKASQVFLALALICSVSLCSHITLAGAQPGAGSYLPQLSFSAPLLEKDRQYLGLDGAQSFTAGQVNSPFILIEIVGVYCPYCHAQAPLFNALYNRIKKNPEMDPKIRIVAVAVGATPMEVDYMKNKFNIPFPVVHDPDFNVHKALGEPRTPFVLVATKQNKVLFAHMGVIEDIDAFLLKLQELTKQQ